MKKKKSFCFFYIETQPVILLGLDFSPFFFPPQVKQYLTPKGKS